MFLPTPGSSTLTVVEPNTTPRLVVAAITAKQRAALARTGRLTLKLTATAAGQIRAEARASLHGRSRRVAYTNAKLANPGTIHLTLGLSAAARARLATVGRLTLRIEVSYTANSSSELSEFQLLERRGGPASGMRRSATSRRSGHHTAAPGGGQRSHA